MAKRGGVFQAFGNLWRWTVWGLAAVLVAALWLGWSNRAAGPEGDVVAGDAVDAGAAGPAAVAEDTAEVVADAAEDTPLEGAASEPGAAAQDTVAEVQSALENALGAAGEVAREAEGAVSDLAEQGEAALDRAQELLEPGSRTAEMPAQELGEVDTAQAAIDREAADLNILPPELSNIAVPGDDATYSLISVFRRDDGTIEVVSDRTENGATVRTIRLVTCAPLAVGVISEAEAPRNEAPELERIPLGSAAATIAALACGAMN